MPNTQCTGCSIVIPSIESHLSACRGVFNVLSVWVPSHTCGEAFDGEYGTWFHRYRGGNGLAVEQPFAETSKLYVTMIGLFVDSSRLSVITEPGV